MPVVKEACPIALSRTETPFPLEPIPIASRDLRARAAAGEPLDGLVPAAVASIIRERGLYRPEAPLHFGGSPKGTDRT